MSRLIDQYKLTSKKPMRVLILSMPRTGQSSLVFALRKLGYTPHTMRTLLSDPSHIPLWQEAVNTTLLPQEDRPAHQRNAPPYGREEFEKLLGDYDVAADLPSAVFAKELVEAYPEAKVILTTRNYKDWETDMQNSLWIFLTWRLFALCRILYITQWAPVISLLHSIFAAHNKNTYSGPLARKAFEKHNETIRNLVPSSNLLEFDERDGWGSICEFLGHEVPNEAFPRVVEGGQMRQGLERAWWRMVQSAVLILALPGLVCIIAYAGWKWQHDIWDILDEVLERSKKLLNM
ncbi:hypothetical protein CC78DRAFT_583870 [Lojkania enalia]|uniref:NAD dependent epimerase/dehydratase n=1 Tax=Lojkania enalia TaxID=147567 RepID=A0A9P4K1Q9_9PLEO|nr:hypothetical protein CC78DRAFT_583870 [Didymosphaeria enalia]